MTDLAKLVVKLEAQTAQYMAQMEKAQKRLEKFDKQSEISAGRIAKGIAVAAAAAAVAFGAMGKAAIDNADRLDKISQSTGIAVESLSQLQYAAEISNLSFEDLAKATAKFSKTAADAARGSDTAARAFETLGIRVQNSDGTLRGTEELLLDVADKFSKMEDGAAKAAIAQDLFSKSGARLIPFLNEGRAGIEKLKKEADAFGLTVSGKAAKAADQFNDNLDRLKAAGKGVANQLVQELLPSFVAISEKFVTAAKSGGALDFSVKALAVTFKALVTAGTIVTSVFQQLGQIVYGVGAAVVQIAQGEFRQAGREITSAFAEARDNVAGDMENIAQIWSDSVPEFEKAATGIDDAMEDSIVFNNEKAEDKAKKAAESALEQIQKIAIGLRQEVETYSMAEDAVMRYRIAQGDLAETFKEAGAAAEPYVDTIVTLTEKLENLKRQTEETADFMKSIDEAVKADIERNREAVEADLDAMQEVAETQSDFEKKAKENVQDILAKGIEDTLEGGVKKGAAGALQAFGDMLTKMAYQAIAAQLAEKIFGGGSGSMGGGGGGGWMGAAMDIVDSFFGGSRDSGGRGKRGNAYAIGRGAQPELFVPDTSGTFLPRDEWMGGGRQQKLTQNIYVQGRVDQRSARQLELESARRQNAAASRLG